MKKWTRIILGVLVLAAAFIWIEVAKSPSADVTDANVHIYFLSVGQGDSELIQKGDNQMLIDGGPDDSVLAQIGKVMPPSDRKIETVVLTHPHADHITGLNSILDRYEIGTIYYSGATYDSSGYREFLDKIKSKNIPLKTPDVGEVESSYDNETLTFLWPGQKYVGQSPANLNNVSEVASFCYFAHCALLTGDIETDEQSAMFDYYANKGGLHSEILKLPHHGSTNGTNQALLDAVKPTYALIEVGAKNIYGHPHAATLDLLDKNNIKYFRTDRDGTIEFVLNETGIIKK